MSYYINKIIEMPFDETVEAVTKALSEQGFGILTDIDIQATLKKKLETDFRQYRILGACNPQFAHKALQVEDKIGVMLPCSVIIQDTPDGKVEVAAMDPAAAMESRSNPGLSEIARKVRDRLAAAIDDL